jgi:TonB family protein
VFGGALLISAEAAQPVMVDEKLVAEGRIDIRPDYPAEAQAQGLTGAGVFVVHVDPKSGRVSSIEVEKSTGHKILDNASIAAFTDLRFKPHTVLRVKIPVTFTMPGDARGPRVVRNFPATLLAESQRPHISSGHSLGGGK